MRIPPAIGSSSFNVYLIFPLLAGEAVSSGSSSCRSACPDIIPPTLTSVKCRAPVTSDVSAGGWRCDDRHGLGPERLAERVGSGLTDGPSRWSPFRVCRRRRLHLPGNVVA